MRNHRGIFLFASAIFWSGTIWGIAQIRPTIFIPNDQPPAPPIITVPILPDPPPPPTPVETEEQEQTPIARPPPMAANPTRKRPEAPAQDYDGPPPTDGIKIAGSGVDTAPEYLGPPKVPEAAQILIADVPDTCDEAARRPTPVAAFNVERAYPTRLEEQEVTGLVHAIWEVDENGLPIEVRIQSSSNSGFNEAVVAEGMKMRFRPARKECENIKGMYALNVKFELNGEQ